MGPNRHIRGVLRLRPASVHRTSDPVDCILRVADNRRRTEPSRSARQTRARQWIQSDTPVRGGMITMWASMNVNVLYSTLGYPSSLNCSLVVGDELLCPSLHVDHCQAHGRDRHFPQQGVCSAPLCQMSFLTPSPRNTYFSKGYFQAGNEPSFELPWIYHYGNRPDLSALRVRDVVYKNFNTKINGYVCFTSLQDP